jgi:aminomethyltransferase
MEAGLLSYRNDMDATNNPFEVRLEKFVDLEQDIDFIGKQALTRIAREGIRRRLMGAIIDGEPLPVNEHRWPVSVKGEVLGELTSCVYSPALERNLAYVMIPIEFAAPGTPLEVGTVVGARPALVCDLPFVANRASDG